MYALTEQLEELLGPVSGTNVNGMWLCPFHNEDTPSLSVHQEEGYWKCWGCGMAGGIKRLYKLLGKELNDDYIFDSLIRSVQRTPSKPTDHTATANQLVANCHGREWQSHLDHYTNVRPVNRSFVDHFRIGFKPESYDSEGKKRFAALAFPYWDATGRATGVKYRSWNGHKYSEDDSEYGLYNVKDVIGKPYVFLSEGESDIHSAWSQLNDTSEIGVAGTSGASIDVPHWTRLGLNFIGAKRIYLCYDNDDAGNRCAADAVRVLGSDRALRVRPTRGKDLSAHILNGGTLDQLNGLEEQDRQLFVSATAN